MSRLIFLSSLVAMLAACPPTQNAAPCTGNPDCSLAAGGQCVASPLGTDQCAYPDPACPSGYSWGELSDGIAGQCLAASDAGVDAPAIDAPTDAGPSAPIVSNHQLADLVIGQPGFSSNGADRGYTANSIAGASVAATNAGVWVSDDNHNRILYFSPLPTVGDPNATIVVGRPSLTDSTAITTPSASNLGPSIRVGAGGGKLVVADRTRNRVLIWNTAPSTSGVAADVVVGQPDMTSSAAGNGASQLAGPGCAWTDGTRLVVCDTTNHRVLVWDTIPTTNGAPANLVLGQTAFGMAVDPTTPSSTVMGRPWSVFSDGTRLLISDIQFNRVLVWASWPATNGAAASFVLGQGNFTESRSVAASPIYTKDAVSVAMYRDAILVSDGGNGRIIVWQPLPTSSGAAASLVLGQPDLQTSAMGTVGTQADFRGVSDLSIVGDKLFVGDLYNRRVLRFTLQ